MLPREHYLKQAFQDTVHFPNGFEKGGLSDIQARLIRKNGTLINALCIDEVSDPTPEDTHILKVIANQSSPRNPVEQAWVKYLSIVKSLSASNPKAKGKTKAAKTTAVETESDPVKPAESIEKPGKAEKITTPAAEVKPKVVAAKKEKIEPEIKVTTKAADTKKVEAVKTETPKADPKKTDSKKADVKKAEPKKAEPSKVEAKKAEAKKDVKKVDVKKTDTKKPAAKKTKS